jgi:pro-kumamolisin-like protein
VRVIAGIAAALGCMAAIASDALASPQPRPPAPAVSPVGQAPRLPSGAHALGALPGSTPIHATVTLAPRDPGALAAYARDVATPGSPVFHHYLTVSQFAEHFGPASADVELVRGTLAAEGLHPGPAAANRLSIPVSASAAQLAGAFHTSLDRYRLPSGATAYANRAAPSVPADVVGVVQGVVGLDSLSRLSPAAAPGAQTVAPGAAQPCSAASTAAGSQGYPSDRIAAAYGLDGLYSGGDLGAGTTVALVEFESYAPADVAAYQSCDGTNASISQVNVDGGPGTAPPVGEATLDIEDVAGLAPQAAIEVYQGPNGGSGPLDTYAKIVSDDTAKVISTSWGACESGVGATETNAENTLFQEATAQGQSVLAAAGDTGTADCPGSSTLAVDDPASQPDVTGVGGTTLTSAQEAAWGNRSGAGGGGVSSVWGAQNYQAGFATAQTSTTCGASGTACREVPDVSADADPQTGYPIYFSGAWEKVGGTSAAAPTWAALLALVDASPACAGKPPVGFANPALYAAARSGYASTFTDIVSGSNSYGGVTGYSAAAGYDMASGLGSPKGAALATTLCTGVVPGPGPTTTTTTTTASTTTTGSTTTSTPLPTPAPPPPTTGTPTAAPAAPLPTVTLVAPSARTGRVGTAQPLSVSARDSAGLILRYAAADLPPGLRIDPRSGVIAGLPTRAGVWAVTVTATDSVGAGARGAFRWTIAGRPTVRLASLRRARSVLALTIAAGAHAAAIQRVAVTAGAHHRAVVIVLRRPSRTARLTIPTAQLPLRAGRGRLTVAVIDASGVRTTLAVEVPSG